MWQMTLVCFTLAYIISGCREQIWWISCTYSKIGADRKTGKFFLKCYIVNKKKHICGQSVRSWSSVTVYYSESLKLNNWKDHAFYKLTVLQYFFPHFLLFAQRMTLIYKVHFFKKILSVTFQQFSIIFSRRTNFSSGTITRGLIILPVAFLNIHTSGHVKIEIFTVSGRRISRKEGKSALHLIHTAF